MSKFFYIFYIGILGWLEYGSILTSKMERGKMAIDTFKNGSIEMLTLLMMQETDIYWYQLVHLLKEHSKGIIPA